MSIRILVLEPYGGGSHAAFYRQWAESSEHRWEFCELPARNWKWRSRHASLTLAERANACWAENPGFDLVLCSSMLNLPEWRGMAGGHWFSIPTLVYFHENQFTYPLPAGVRRDYHFAYSSVLTAMAADRVWFNSRFHLDEFRAAARKWLRRMPDHPHLDRFDACMQRASVRSPGIECSPLGEEQLHARERAECVGNRPRSVRPQEQPPARERAERDVSQIVQPQAMSADGANSQPIDAKISGASEGNLPSNRPANIGWVARWEHDKRPDRFVAAIANLLEKGYDFRLILLGQRCTPPPREYQALEAIAGSRILRTGYAESPQAYRRQLAEMDIVVSTAEHEFFGIGVLEAIAAGAIPCLPRSLAYPEVLRLTKNTDFQACFYEPGEAGCGEGLRAILDARQLYEPLIERLQREARRFSWQRLAPLYDRDVEAICSAPRTHSTA